MSKSRSRVLICSIALIALLISVFITNRNEKGSKSLEPEVQSDSVAQAENAEKLKQSFGKIPLHFEPNVGQTDERVKFISRGHGYSLFLTDAEALLSLKKNGENKSAVVRMELAGANRNAKSRGADKTEGKSNYFIGNDSKKWQKDVPNYLKVKYEQVYKGVDLVYYGNQQQLEYDFIVQPNSDPEQIKLDFDGITDAQIDAATGDLVLKTNAGELRQHKPLVYQDVNGERREIASNYRIAKDKEQKTKDKFSVSFEIADYDKSKELVIDPILVYGSYLGGNVFDEGRAITVDSQGNAYIVGTAASRDFPTTQGTIKPVLLPRTDAPNSFWYDAFVTKVNPTGTALVFSTYFGGRNGNESGSGVAVDASGNVLISGTTMSADLPTVNPYQAVFGGTDDAFAAKLNPTGSAIIYSTYLGGNNTELGGKIALNQTTGDAVFVGYDSSGNFPTTPGAFKERLCTGGASCNGIFYSGSYAVKFSANGDVIYSTLFDAAISDVTLDSNDNATFGGAASAGAPTTAGAFQPASSGGGDGYIAKLNPTGSALVFGTFLGGGLQSDSVSSIALDSADNIYVTGKTENTGFPTTEGVLDRTFNGGEDGFVTKLNAAGSALIYSTFLGGTAKDQPFAIGLGENNNAFITGETTSFTTFPLRNSLNGTSGTIFLTRLNADASALVFSGFLGNGGGYDIAVDASSNAYVTGHTTSILVTPDSFQPMKGDPTSTSTKDAFVLKIGPTDENAQMYGISGNVTDPTQFGNQTPVVVTLTGTVNRSITLPYGSGSGVIPYSFSNLPAGGNYVVTVKKVGFATDPQSATFNNLGANQFADFSIVPNQKPVATIVTPTHGQTFNAPATINITATASDPDGHAISKVDFVIYSSETGSFTIGTDTTAPYEFTWTNVPAGTWSINAIPTDELGLRGESTPVVHVQVVDPSPVSVSITNPTNGQTFTEGDTVPFSVNVSSSVVSVEIRDQNFNLITGMGNGQWTSQWYPRTPGTYTLTATARNSQNQTATSQPVTITVNPINHRIKGRIYDSITNNGVSGITVNLTSSTNPNISATTTTDASGNYLFTNLGTTPNDDATITPVSSQYTFNPSNKHIFYLGYIEWNENFVATRQTQINVAMTSPANGQSFNAPATINLAANATSGAGAITQVEFYRVQGASTTLLATDATAPYEHQLTGVGVGNYTYFARATDSTNATAQSQSVSITVKLPTVRLSGRITGAGGNGVQNVQVYVAGGYAWSVRTDVNGNYQFENLPGGKDYYITPLPENTITFTPTSRSFMNVTSDITGIDFTASAPNQSPTVQFISPTNGATYTMPEPIPLHVVANDPDNNIISLRVVANNGHFAPTIAQTTNSTINTLWQPTEPGTYLLTALVRDNGPLPITAEITITVNPPSPVSIAGRIVNRDSQGIEGVTLELKNYPQEDTVIATVTTDANGNYTIPNLTTFRSYSLRASKLNYTFAPQRRIYTNLSASQTADFTGTLQVQAADFDGDGESDVSVWRPSTGVWYVRRSGSSSYSALQFGGGAFGDIVTPGNYDGDNKTDYAVYRGGVWYLLNSSNSSVQSLQFGVATDKPVPGDYDGDGKTDIAVWRPSTGVWYIIRSSDGSIDIRQFGLDGDMPLAGDYDGDGKGDLTVWRPSSGVWYVLQTSDGSFRAFQFGSNGDTPLVGDFDGDKTADFTLWRPSTGVWYSYLSSNNSYKIFQWGVSSDTPIPGDYDKDGKTDIAVFRKSEGNWYIFKSSTNTHTVYNFGVNGDVPIPAAYMR